MFSSLQNEIKTEVILIVVLVFLSCAKKEKPLQLDAGQVDSAPTHSDNQHVSKDGGKPGPQALPKRIFTKKFVVKIRKSPDKDSYRIGYLRGGAVLMAKTAEPVGDTRCRRGWYELETGGFVCSTHDVIPFYGRRLPERRATQPDLKSPLPYLYGYNLRDNTPVYRRLPKDKEAARFEDHQKVRQSTNRLEEETEKKLDRKLKLEVVRNESEGPGHDAGYSTLRNIRTEDNEAVQREKEEPHHRNETDHSSHKIDQSSEDKEQLLRLAGEPGSAIQHLERESTDAGTPTLESLLGNRDSVLQRRLQRGFYVSLDREMRRGQRRYWRTQANGFIPFDRLRVVRVSGFHGVHLSDSNNIYMRRQEQQLRNDHVIAVPSQKKKGILKASTNSALSSIKVDNQKEDQTDWRLPIGFLIRGKTWAYARKGNSGLRRVERPGYHFVFNIIGEEEIHRRRYYFTKDGKYFHIRDVTRINARLPPKEVKEDEKWIDVDLEKQTLVAYIGIRPVYATLVSSGRVKERDNPLMNFETPSGSFRILSKHLTHTMDGDHAVDGPYSIEDVPYVMYFQLAYALHSAFWHNTFGRPRSHGCINMAPLDAKWLFNWITPRLPPKWHSAYPVEGSPGTRLYIRGVTPVS